jgi:hypothetical protein
METGCADTILESLCRQAELLAHLLGSPTGSRKTWSLQQLMSWQYGRSISWPDIARMVGADAGDHDNVRACAKGLQERLPRMKREGKF